MSKEDKENFLIPRNEVKQMGKKINLRLDTPSNIRKSLAKITNMVVNGELPTGQANTIILACNAILGSIRVDEQEKKIKELEELINEIQK